ncbi:alternative ribosome rescue aminoacyl-tRNA hydrolase ArfB [Luteococcus peritonei]|uniref:Alternative ribosome rescue aminoacyl-tRNA hydrolase ArfB n=1 Tax=Luteococcus peritonei TaxID=88874 RepID=A0ABW4RZ81_9ACTN
MDLQVRPGPGVPRGLLVPAAELAESFSRASGPGGQGVNTTDSRVQLSLDLATSQAFDDKQRARLLTNLAGRLDGTVLSVDASEERHQRRNRVLARERMADLLREALAPPPPPRRATRPTRGSVRRRLEAKKQRSQTKALRGRPRD